MVPNGYGNAGKEGVQLGVALVGIGSGDDRRGGRILGFDTVDLLGIEDGVTLEERHLPLAILAAFSALVGVHLDPVSIDDGRALLALADATAERKRLLEGQPMRGAIALRHGSHPKG